MRPDFYHQEVFTNAWKGDSRLVPGPDYTTSAIEPPIQALAASLASLKSYVAWRCHDRAQHIFYRSTPTGSGHLLASIWWVDNSRGPNWVFGLTGVAHSEQVFPIPTKHPAKPKWPLISAWQTFGPVHRDWIMIIYGCLYSMWPLLRRQSSFASKLDRFCYVSAENHDHKFDAKGSSALIRVWVPHRAYFLGQPNANGSKWFSD